MTSIRPAGHHLLVKPLEVKNETESGIIVTVKGSQIERLEKAGRMIGEVVALGPQCWVAHAAALLSVTDDTRVLEGWAVVGEMVIYSRHAGKFVFDPISGEELYLIHDEDVLAGLPPQDDWEVDMADLTH